MNANHSGSRRTCVDSASQRDHIIGGHVIDPDCLSRRQHSAQCGTNIMRVPIAIAHRNARDYHVSVADRFYLNKVYYQKKFIYKEDTAPCMLRTLPRLRQIGRIVRLEVQQFEMDYFVHRS